MTAPKLTLIQGGKPKNPQIASWQAADNERVIAWYDPETETHHTIYRIEEEVKPKWWQRLRNWFNGLRDGGY